MLVCFLFTVRGIQREREHEEGKKREGARVPVPLIIELGEERVFSV